VAKTANKIRGKFADEKYWGPEPTPKGDVTELDLLKAFNWFNYFHSTEDAKSFTISYLKSIKYNKSTIQKISQIPFDNLRSTGWMFRILIQGGDLPAGKKESLLEKIEKLVEGVIENTESEESSNKNVISIQDRINAKASELTGELDEQLDVFFTEGVITFNVKDWMRERDIKPQIAKKIVEKFQPRYEEVKEAFEGKNPDLVEAYKGWRKPVLKVMAIFMKGIIDCLNTSIETHKVIKKPRKKKVKPAGVLVAKMKYMVEDTALNLKSVDPKEIIGASQLWVFNTKYRNLTVYNAAGAGLTVMGSSIKGFDESSITKKLRKVADIINQVKSAGKVPLRKIMDGIKSKPKTATGRINSETILVRVVK